MTIGTDTPSLPSALTSLQRKLAVGWTAQTLGPATGTIEVSYKGEPRSDGTRPILHRDAPVTSYALKACHRDSGRAFVALWVHRLGDHTSKGKPSWSLDVAVRGRHENEHAPQHLNSQELAAYAASRSVEEYESALKALEARKASKTDTTETGTSVPTEEAA